MTSHNDESEPPSAHADDAAEAIRQLNHATLNEALRRPSTAAHIVDGLKAMVEGLPQALQQIDEAVAGMHATGRMYSWGNPEQLTEDAADARVLFAAAQAQAFDMAATLTRLQALLGQFGMRDE